MSSTINNNFEEIKCRRPINSAFSFEQLYIEDFDRLITIIGVNHKDEIKCKSIDKLDKPISISEYCEFSLKNSNKTKLLIETNPRKNWINQIENYDDKFLKDISSLIKNGSIKNSQIIPIDFRSNCLEAFYSNNKEALNNMAKKRGDCFFIDNIDNRKISMQSILYNNENLGTLKSPIMLFDIFIETIPSINHILENHHYFLSDIGKSSGPIKLENKKLVLYKGIKRLEYLEKHNNFICNTLIKDIDKGKEYLRSDFNKILYEGRDRNLEVSMTERLKLIWAKVMDIHTILEILSPDNTTDHIIHVVGDRHLKNIKDKFEKFEKSLIKVTRKLKNKKNCIEIYNSYTLKDAHKFLCKYKKGKRKSINDDIRQVINLLPNTDYIDNDKNEKSLSNDVENIKKPREFSPSEMSQSLDQTEFQEITDSEFNYLAGLVGEGNGEENENYLTGLEDMVFESNNFEDRNDENNLTEEELDMVFENINFEDRNDENNLTYEESLRALEMLSENNNFEDRNDENNLTEEELDMVFENINFEERDDENNLTEEESLRALEMLSENNNFYEIFQKRH